MKFLVDSIIIVLLEVNYQFENAGVLFFKYVESDVYRNLSLFDGFIRVIMLASKSNFLK